ncbi:MAG TPA: prephenate dehydrogenase/arogenate dehydrogenase family protein [Gemmataceae bacterium]|jgi:prephenate dehydrogenase|nr:prephenate dehydrogenase/arogenate dehydrogenase family protein [Gemmataceae bacterium]
MKIRTLTIVGVGLIGGSIGLAAKRRGLVARVRGVGWRQQTLDQALARGAIDEAALDLATAVPGSDVIVFCTPVDGIVGQLLAAAPLCAAGTLLTDAGSTKAVIVRGVEGRLPVGVVFVGSHPLAGSEKRGPQYAEPDLFQGRLTVVTRTDSTPAEAVARATAFWQALGSRVRVMEPEEHDRALALTSHLPHLVASALAQALPPELHELTATGFRDTTRVAAGDPALWTGIFCQNRAAVLDALDRFGAHLDRFRQALEAGDPAALAALLDQAKTVRDALKG